MAPDYRRRSEGAGIEEDARTFVLALARRFGPSPRVLELGSGPATDAWRLRDAGAKVVCLDAAPTMLLTAARRSVPALLAGGDLLQLPFGDETFAGAWACGSLLHVPSTALPAALLEARRVLLPAGLAYLTLRAGSGQRITGPSPGLTRLFSYFSEPEIEKTLADAGFAPLSSDTRLWPNSLVAEPWLHFLARRA